MLKKRFPILLTAVVFVAVSCSNPEDDKKEKKQDDVSNKETAYYSGNLSEEQKESTHLTLKFFKNIIVDADVTNPSQYKDGLDSYFIGYMNNDKRDSISSYCKKPDIYGMPLSKFMKELADTGQCGFSEKKRDVNYRKEDGGIRIAVSCRDDDNVKRELSFQRYLTGKNTLGGIDGMLFQIKDDAHKDESLAGECDFGEGMTSVFPDYDMDDLSFGKKEEIGGRLKDLTEKTLKLELSDKYDCMPITRDTYRMLTARLYDNKSERIRPFHSDYYYYRFYPMVNGLRWVDNSRRVTVKEEPIADDVGTQSEMIDNQTKKVTSRTLSSMSEGEQVFIYNEKGIREMRLSNIIENKGVYKKKLEICPLETVLTNVQARFMGKGVVLPATIYNIELCYASAFSDISEGKIRNVLEPCWMVEYWEEAWDGKRCTAMWVDAMTGEVINEDDVN